MRGKELKMKRNKLGMRITIVQTVLISVMASIIILVSYFAFRGTYLRFYYDKAQDIVRILANETEWDKLSGYAETGVEDEYSRTLQSLYDDVKTNSTGIDYLYLFVPGEKSFTYILEAVKPGDNLDMISKWGEEYPYGEDEYKMLVPDIKAKKESTEIHLMNENTDSPGLEVWAPVFDSSGEMRAMVEADYRLPQIFGELNNYVIRIILIILASILVAIILLYIYLYVSLVKPINALTNEVSSYEHGEMNLNMKPFTHDDELRFMAVSFEEMTHRIERYNDEVKRISAEKERISTELSIATQIQSGMLPAIIPNFVGKEEYELYALMTPAKEVGGDFYDFFNIDDDHLALVIADVSGKGVPAALFMMMSMVLIKSRTQQGGTPAEILEYVNDQLCLSNPNEMFVTIWLGIIDLGTGNVIASSAGHEFPVIAGEDGEYKLFKDPHGFVCGGMEGMIYQDYEFSIPKGGRLFVYTDGVPEAHNEKDELFEFDRIEDVLNRNKKATPKDTVSEMMKAIKEFAGSKEQFDDITMLSFLYKGKTNA